jgi:hypothetical protein
MTERLAHNVAYPNGPCDYPSFASRTSKEVIPQRSSACVTRHSENAGKRLLWEPFGSLCETRPPKPHERKAAHSLMRPGGGLRSTGSLDRGFWATMSSGSHGRMVPARSSERRFARSRTAETSISSAGKYRTARTSVPISQMEY